MLTNSATLVPENDRATLEQRLSALVEPEAVGWIAAAAAVVAGWAGTLTLICAFVIVRSVLI